MLSDKRIKEELANGNIIIDPFDERHLGTNSYDCRLGPYYYRANWTTSTIYYLENDGDITRMWGEPYRALKHIHISPGETVLAHTLETIGGCNGFLAKMQARSTIARWGLSICKCAGVGDVGYVSHWTMEISNHTQNTISIPVGFRIAQMIFEEVGPTDKEYHTTSHSGNYGREWSPIDLLPQKLKDWDRQEIERIQHGLIDGQVL